MRARKFNHMIPLLALAYLVAFPDMQISVAEQFCDPHLESSRVLVCISRGSLVIYSPGTGFEGSIEKRECSG